MAWWKFWKKDTTSLEHSDSITSGKQIKIQSVNSVTAEENLEKLARSNYLLLRIRQLLNLKAEYYSKWEQVGRAFNGGFFYSDTEHPLTDVYFHNDLDFYRDHLKHIQIGDILVSIGTQNTDLDFENLLNAANDKFEKLLNQEGEKILSQVSRFLINAGCWEKEENPERVKSLVDKVCAEFSTSTIFPIQEIFPFGMPDLGANHEYTVEVILNKPISKDEFIEIMKNYFPNLEGQIFGYGFSRRNPVPEIEFWITLYARQF